MTPQQRARLDMLKQCWPWTPYVPLWVWLCAELVFFNSTTPVALGVFLGMLLASAITATVVFAHLGIMLGWRAVRRHYLKRVQYYHDREK